jgi:hypothetical protein
VDQWYKKEYETRTNQELRELYKDLDIVAGIKKEHWNGLAIVREGVKLLVSKPEGSRKSGRTRLRLLKDVEKDLR